MKRYGFLWLVLGFLVLSLAAQIVGQVVMEGDSWASACGDLGANLAGEMLSLVIQVLGLKYLLCWGSPQSREGQDRMEKKIDWLVFETLKKSGMSRDEVADALDSFSR